MPYIALQYVYTLIIAAQLKTILLKTGPEIIMQENLDIQEFLHTLLHKTGMAGNSPAEHCFSLQLDKGFTPS